VALALEEAEREVLALEVERLCGALASPRARQRFGGLAAAVAAGEVPAELAEALADCLELALESGVARRIHGPEGEQALAAVLRRTPRGSTVEEAARQANRALAALAGQRLRRLAFVPGLPGACRLVVETDACQLSFDIDRRGVRAREVTVGG
jgi:hypothetical protein